MQSIVFSGFVVLFCTCVGFLMLWAELINLCGRKKEHSVRSIPRFFPHLLLPTVYQCDRYLSSWGRGGSWLVCQALPAISAVSILELAASYGSSRMSSATST